MSIEIMSVITTAGTPIAGAVIGIVLGILPIIKDAAENNWRKRFRKQVRLGILKSHLTYDDMQHIAERWSQDRKSVLLSLRVMHSEAISGEDEDLAKHVDPIRELIQKHQKQEPYSELPENISIQLSGLNSKTENQDKISQLASSLSDLYASNQKKLLRQVKFTYWGTLAGVIGVFIGVVGLYLALVGHA
jgi:hypothetical protein